MHSATQSMLDAAFKASEQDVRYATDNVVTTSFRTRVVAADPVTATTPSPGGTCIAIGPDLFGDMTVASTDAQGQTTNLSVKQWVKQTGYELDFVRLRVSGVTLSQYAAQNAGQMQRVYNVNRVLSVLYTKKTGELLIESDRNEVNNLATDPTGDLIVETAGVTGRKGVNTFTQDNAFGLYGFSQLLLVENGSRYQDCDEGFQVQVSGEDALEVAGKDYWALLFLLLPCSAQDGYPICVDVEADVTVVRKQSVA